MNKILLQTLTLVSVLFVPSLASAENPSEFRQKTSAASILCGQAFLQLTKASEHLRPTKADETIKHCKLALSKLNALGRNVATVAETDKRFLFYVAGNVQYFLAGSYLYKNAGKLNKATCNHAITGRNIWKGVNPVADSKLEHDMENADFAKNLTKNCELALANSKK